MTKKTKLIHNLRNGSPIGKKNLNQTHPQPPFPQKEVRGAGAINEISCVSDANHDRGCSRRALAGGTRTHMVWVLGWGEEYSEFLICNMVIPRV